MTTSYLFNSPFKQLRSGLISDIGVQPRVNERGGLMASFSSVIWKSTILAVLTKNCCISLIYDYGQNVLDCNYSKKAFYTLSMAPEKCG